MKNLKLMKSVVYGRVAALAVTTALVAAVLAPVGAAKVHALDIAPSEETTEQYSEMGDEFRVEEDGTLSITLLGDGENGTAGIITDKDEIDDQAGSAESTVVEDEDLAGIITDVNDLGEDVATAESTVVEKEGLAPWQKGLIAGAAVIAVGLVVVLVVLNGKKKNQEAE